jgi:hypothetical protein
VRIDCSSCNEGGLPDSLSRGWRQDVGAQMNGSDDEQHDAHVKVLSYTQLIEPTSSASAARGRMRRRPLPLSFCLPPVEPWCGTSPIQAASRPKHRRIRRRRNDRGHPQNPDARDGANPPAHLVRAVLGYDFGLGSSGKLDFGPLLPTMRGNSSLKMAAPARDRT